ncbi:MAG TPA: hypothetical protein VKE30_10555 [Chthoniobacterales bacterium]|nr:hypothetical protein [Chthoniobacterales bacterium]
MQLLIVHSDPEMGEALVQTVKGYTPQRCELVGGDNAAMEWAIHGGLGQCSHRPHHGPETRGRDQVTSPLGLTTFLYNRAPLR